MAKKNRRKVRQLVFRFYAERYLLLLLISFALSLSFTRLFLEITGYPQIGNSELHFAHVLWGGLIWFSGSLLPLIFANRRAFDLSAILTGIGFGLFIDEVGKFITSSNNYFYPSAAPIIYVFFLITILVFQLVRKQTPLTAREHLYRILEQFEELIEGDLSDIERKHIADEFIEINNKEKLVNLRQLAAGLYKIIQDNNQQLVPHKPDFFEKVTDKWNQVIASLFQEGRKPVWLFILWSFLGLISILHPVASLYVFRNNLKLPWVLSELLSLNFGSTTEIRFLESLRLVGEGVLGVALVLASGLGFAGKTSAAAFMAYFGNLIMLVFINLLVFFFDQFSAIIFASIQLVGLLLTNQYREYLKIH